jgi:putative ABC transport system ATP-binding protein
VRFRAIQGGKADPNLVANSGNGALIDLQGIERVFHLGDSEVHALHELDLRVAAGEYVAVMGPSGSGKSTLLNLIGLLDRPTAGSYLLEGRDVTTLSAEEQARVRSTRIGFVFQSFHLVPPNRGGHRADDARGVRRTAAWPSRRSLITGSRISSTGPTSSEDSVSVATRATIMQPALILADEPTGNLDRATGEEVVRLLEKLNSRGVTLIVVTHDGTLGARARRRIDMEDGSVKHDTAAG